MPFNSTSTQSSQLADTAIAVQDHFKHPVDVGIILGSGLGAFADSFENAVSLPYSQLPHFPQSTVVGHSGRLVLAKPSKGPTVACLQGRFHYYEGYGHDAVTYPVRLLKRLGIKTLIVTNAAGGIREDLNPGSLMLISDHLNLMGQNPLMGKNDDQLGPRFVDMSVAYDANLRQLAHTVAQQQGTQLTEGVYCGLSGPTYETPAEIRMLKTLGADAVGMSTVPEVIAARHAGIRVLGISCITNKAAGLGQVHLNHAEVIETGQTVANTFEKLLHGLLNALT
ncbi:MAG: purine-nucleoside phosphorylase [Vampirovibrionales bacterium]